VPADDLTNGRNFHACRAPLTFDTSLIILEKQKLCNPLTIMTVGHLVSGVKAPYHSNPI
jgi:hypothetical protein